jgi:methylmalonyl-CoA/ethylmalonyl-CoA epimerase
MDTAQSCQPAMEKNITEIPGFLCIDHIAIAVKPGELEAQLSAYRTLGFEEVHREDVLGTDQVREVLLQVGDGPNCIQLLEPLSPDSPVARQLENNFGRGGFAHIAFRVDDINNTFEYMKANGFRIIDKSPRKGSRGTTVFFVHPKTSESAVFGYLMEIVQHSHNSPSGR